MEYVVCYSGGHSSALCAVEAVRKHGRDNVTLLNHDISSNVECEDTKRFKREVADYLGLEITYANMDNFEKLDPIALSIKNNLFGVGGKYVLCTSYLKTEPFSDWLKSNYPAEKDEIRDDVTFIYGFDKNEGDRIKRRTRVMLEMGYRTEYPIVDWERTIYDISEVGIRKPKAYNLFKHSNCMGCLKAGAQHWYLTYCLRPDLVERAIEAEEKVGQTIIRGKKMKDLKKRFEFMKDNGVKPTEKIPHQTFWANVRRLEKAHK